MKKNSKYLLHLVAIVIAALFLTYGINSAEDVGTQRIVAFMFLLGMYCFSAVVNEQHNDKQ